MSSLRSEADLLSSLLSKNTSQHRRAGYFRALTGASSGMVRLLPCLAKIPDTLDGNELSVEKSERLRQTLNEALVLATDVARHLRRGARTLKQQVAAGYFIALCISWLSITARSLVLLRFIVLQILGARRTLGMPSVPVEIRKVPLAGTLDWLISFCNPTTNENLEGDSLSLHVPNTSRGSGTSSSASAVVGSNDDDDDVGEAIAFSHDLGRSEPPEEEKVAVASLLAADYSDSEESEAEGKSRQAISVANTSSWVVDTTGATLDFFSKPAATDVFHAGPNESSPRGVKAAEKNVSEKAQKSDIVLATDYSDSEGENSYSPTKGALPPHQMSGTILLTGSNDTKKNVGKKKKREERSEHDTCFQVATAKRSSDNFESSKKPKKKLEVNRQKKAKRKPEADDIDEIFSGF